MERSAVVGWGLVVVFCGGLATAGAAFFGAPEGLVVALGATMPSGILVAGQAAYHVARGLGASRARAVGYTLRMGLHALLELAP